MKMHKNNLVKRGFAVLLALALVVGMMPMMALAANHTYGNGDCNVCKNGSGNSNNHVWGSDGKCECCGKTGGPTTPSVSPDPSTPPETETPEPTDQPEHVHSHTGIITTQPTCTEAGVKTFTCECGDSYTEQVEKLDHDFTGSYVPTGTGGQHWHECLYGCGAHDSAVAHNMVEDNREPTCKEPGHTGGICADCGYDTGKDIPALQHKWTIHDKKAPTCTENGFDNVHCQYCGMKSATASQIFLSKGHQFNAWTVDEAGHITHSHSCKVCGLKETEAHTGFEWETVSEDDVSKVESRVCDDCGYKETKTTSKVCRHPATETRKEHQDATCVTAGYDVTICGVCDAEVERHDIPAGGHTYDAWTDNGEENHIHTCVNEGCTAGTEGHAVTAAHDFSEWETTAYPTYGIPGREERACATCGREESREIPALVGPPVIPPPVVVPDEPDEPIEEPDVPLDPTPEEPDEPIEEPDVPLDPAPEEPDEPIEEPDVPLDPTPEEPDEPIEEPDVPLDPTPDEPVDEPDVPLNPAPEEPAGGNGNGGSGANDEEILEDGEIPLADVPKTSDDLSLLWILVLACGATLMARCLSRKERTQR